ncbi:MAG: hypothetical protein D6832_06775, partial [Alphaproteobacteria bacterium]
PRTTAEEPTSFSPEELAALRQAGIPLPDALLPPEAVEGDEAAQPAAPGTAAAPPAAGPAPEPETPAEVDGILVAVRAPAAPEPVEDVDLLLPAELTPIESSDAFALPDYSEGPGDEPLAPVAPPPPPGQVFAVDERGLVRATPEGVVTPDGVLVRLGRPTPAPEPRPVEILRQINPLAGFRPQPRPEDLLLALARQIEAERLRLAGVRPQPRPPSAQDLIPPEGATAPVIAAAPAPPVRPADMPERVAAARAAAARAAAVASAPSAAAPVRVGRIPTNASVARRATTRRALDLTELNLIGVFGKRSRPRALLRLPSGRIVRVKVGDRVQGARVVAIDEKSVALAYGSRTRVLKMPRSP